MFDIAENDKNSVASEGAKIRVIGVGGGGCNAVNTMIKEGLTGVDYIVANTDAQALNASLAPTKIQLGAEITKGLGAGANPEVGREAAIEERQKLEEVLEGSDMVFITSGMGGGTGTGAAPIIAEIAREMNALTVGVVTKPFMFEGKKRTKQAEAGIAVLEAQVDSLITIPNQKLLSLAGETLSLIDTFRKADEVLLNAVRGISDLINTTGKINADFADVCTVMSNKGFALMGTGMCSGPDRAIKAATEAISSPLLEDISIDGATGIIVNITGSETLSMHEVTEASTLIMEAADEDAEIIFGTVIDNTMEDEIKVTVIATGLGGRTRVTAADVRRSAEIKREQAQPVIQTINELPEEIIEEPAASIQEDLPLMENSVSREEVIGRPSLADSIKEAASNYENQKTNLNVPPKAPTLSEESSASSSRAKSIAEKLGFINFDEDELDTPSYLRKEQDNNDAVLRS